MRIADHTWSTEEFESAVGDVLFVVCHHGTLLNRFSQILRRAQPVTKRHPSVMLRRFRHPELLQLTPDRLQTTQVHRVCSIKWIRFRVNRWNWIQIQWNSPINSRMWNCFQCKSKTGWTITEYFHSCFEPKISYVKLCGVCRANKNKIL